MIDAMIPVYQRHLTHGDVDAIIGFYSSPVGQKMTREMPEMMKEAMQAVSVISQNHMDRVMARVRERVIEMKKAHPPSGQRN